MPYSYSWLQLLLYMTKIKENNEMNEKIQFV